MVYDKAAFPPRNAAFWFMDIEIRKAKPADIPAILELMREFAGYERIPEYFEATADRLFAAMFGPDAFVEALIAVDGGRGVGYAIFYPNFATFRGQRGYFLEDLFVSEAGRRHGLGERMLRETARMAKNRGFERVDFLVLDWNRPAIDFYKKLGASVADDETHFKFTDEAFARLSGESA
jgi:GNAT superfamily N-acetyltransferase